MSYTSKSEHELVKLKIDFANLQQTLQSQTNQLAILEAEKAALTQSAFEIFTANLNARANNVLQEKVKNDLMQAKENEVKALQQQIKELNDRLTIANAIVEKSTNLIAPENDQ